MSAVMMGFDAESCLVSLAMSSRQSVMLCGT